MQTNCGNIEKEQEEPVRKVYIPDRTTIQQPTQTGRPWDTIQALSHQSCCARQSTWKTEEISFACDKRASDEQKMWYREPNQKEPKYPDSCGPVVF